MPNCTAAETQLKAQNILLGKIAQGHPLSDILNTLIVSVEQQQGSALGSILLLDRNNCLRHGAAATQFFMCPFSCCDSAPAFYTSRFLLRQRPPLFLLTISRCGSPPLFILPISRCGRPPLFILPISRCGSAPAFYTALFLLLQRPAFYTIGRAHV